VPVHIGNHLTGQHARRRGCFPDQHRTLKETFYSFSGDAFLASRIPCLRPSSTIFRRPSSAAARNLKGQPKHTASVNLIRDRMIDRMPNVSRLLNKLIEKSLVKKDRQTADQRVVHIQLTELGIKTAEQGRKLFESVTYSLTTKQAKELNDLLDCMHK